VAVAAPETYDVSIVICTYDRPDGLAKTLASCLAQINELGLKVEIVVVDNHPSGSGRPVVEGLGGQSMPLRYVTELTRNMSTLRNRGFAEARGERVAFIDDDEVAASDWLDRLVGALSQADADIAIGPRLAIFAAGRPPAYDPDGAQFTRDLKLPDGAEVELTTPSGKPRYGLGTGNSLFHKARCFPGGAEAMRVEFGDAGGEDAELFVRLHRQGRKIVWAAEAFVTETVPEHRTEVAYRLIRTKRETQHYVSIYLDAANRSPVVWATLMAKGVIQVACGAILALVTGELGSKRRLKARLLIAHGMGKLDWNRAVGYIREKTT
jgi:succinoglycan biosynthesis protein ExoM